ncbi:hypothetical protein GCM10029964_098530 [Kibdelosporangium lantanae]
MKVLFTPNNARQHLYPMVPLAWACRAAGHQVQVAAPPAMAAVVREVGLPGVAVGRDIPPPGLTFQGLTARFYNHTRFPRDWPQVVHLLTDDQRDLLEQWGRNAARGRGRPSTT